MFHQILITCSCFAAAVSVPPAVKPQAPTTTSHPSGHAGKHKLDSGAPAAKSGNSETLFMKSIMDEVRMQGI